jgi:WD40 repeat protein
MKAKPLLIFILSLFVLSCTAQEPSVTTSENGHSLTLVWESEFTPEAGVGAGVDIARGPDGSIYITTDNVKKYDDKGRFILEWGGTVGTGGGQFALPTGIAVGPDGSVYVDDFRNRRIQKFDSEGNFLLEWQPDPLGQPGSIAVDQNGDVYVSMFQAADHNIQKFDSNGNLITSWGGTGSGDGEFAGRIEDIALDKDGNLYVTDSYNHSIQKFDPDGNFLARFGGTQSDQGRGQFTDTEGIAVDYDGNIYVVDTYFLQKLDANGNFITQWSRTQGGDLDRAGFLTLDEENNIYILANTRMTTETGTFDVEFIKKFSQSN